MHAGRNGAHLMRKDDHCEQVVDATLIAIMINTFANITITIVIIVSLLVVQYYYPSKSSSSQYSSPG